MKSDKQETAQLFQQHLIKSICPEYSNQNFMFLLNHASWINYSLGCMFGSFIGDSLGAYVEFAKKLDSKTVDQAMKMTPGGTFNLRSGQVTDDSEMSFHLLQALLRINLDLPLEQQKIDIQFNIAEEYVDWKKSKPFDIGNTCRTGIVAIQQIIKESKPKTKAEKEYCLQKIEKKVRQTNNKSQSNGSLMKITPLVFFGIAFSYLYPPQTKEVYKQIVKNQIQLLHPNEIVIFSSRLWFKTLWLICNRRDNKVLSQIYDKTMAMAKEHQHLKEWALQVQQKNTIEAQPNQGWAKIAWSLGMRYLRSIKETLDKNPSYQIDSYLYTSIVRRVIQKGGDTDTNAAIVGGLIGSIIGFKNLPKEYLSKILSLSFANKELKRGHDRSEFYEPRTVFVKIYRFLSHMYSAQLSKKVIKPKH